MDRFEEEKKLAAIEATKYVRDGMLLGMGSGSTVKYFIEALASYIKEKGINVTAVPSSKETAQRCKENGIPVYDGDTVPIKLDLTVDGADEFDPQLNLVKGGGGDLLWEKIIASASQQEIIISDSRKEVATLGQTFKLPVEVVPYAIEIVEAKLTKAGLHPTIRMNADGSRFYTDENNCIFDCETGEIADLYGLSQNLDSMIGVAEHGLFLDMADMVIMGCVDKIQNFYRRSEIITAQTQNDTMKAIFEKIALMRSMGQVPVIEADLDLTTFVPTARTIEALRTAGEEFGIREFINPSFDLLPGYTRAAWINFISRNGLAKKYPDLRWIGDKDGKGGKNVYSVFHTRFWDTELLNLDTLTHGFKDFVEKANAKGAVVVLVSGRWKPEQTKPTLEVLAKEHLENIPLMIGNPHHDSDRPISDSEIKALHQPEIREKYGVPALFVDDRIDNRKAVIDANPGIDMLSIGISIPGFTYDDETAGVPLKISTWSIEKI